MEGAISSLTFKGSISDAIVEAKKQKKLFVVYLSGKDAEVDSWETSTWTDSKVAEALSKYCVFLHLLEGVSEVAHLSAIYPQKPAPCITVIGYNGTQLWQTEGSVSAEILASGLEKAWLGLHIQETFLMAALSSKQSIPSDSGVSPFAQGSSTSADRQPPMDRQPQSCESGPSVAVEIVDENKNRECMVKKDKASSGSGTVIELKDDGCDLTISSTRTIEEFPDATVDLGTSTQDSSCEETISKISFGSGVSELTSQLAADTANVATENKTSADFQNPTSASQTLKLFADPVGAAEETSAEKESAPEGASIVMDHGSRIPGRTSQMIADKANLFSVDKKDESGKENIDALDIDSGASSEKDAHLNIKLPDGTSLQVRFPVTSILCMVKEYIDEHQSSDLGSYDLAIPYPRKVYNNQDMSKSFSDLGLVGRQALIVVPHHQAIGQHRGEILSRDQTSSSGSPSETDGGYFSHVKKLLSFINPFSYLGDGGSSSISHQKSQWQNDPSNPSEAERPYIPYSQNGASGSSRIGSMSRQTTSRFGSNIHTLKHDDDDERFNDRNAFWNGNSTQYGGDGDDK